MNNELVSIIIPCYGQAHLLHTAVRSCLEQSYPRIEIIVVDDGSPDNVPKAVETFGSKIRLIRQKNRGLSSARNAGLAMARGAYVKFLDSDDWLLPNCVEHQYSSLCNLGRYVSVIGYRIWHDTTGAYGEEVYPDFGKLSHALCYVNTGPPHTYLFSTDAVKNINGFDTSDRVDGGHEDYDLVCRLSLQGYEVVGLHTIGCVYRQSANSMSTNLENMSRSRSKVWLHFAKEMLKKDCDASQLVHLIGGYTLRLESNDIRYEATKLLERMSVCLEEYANDISNNLAIELCNDVVKLMRNLPKAMNAQETQFRQLSFSILDRLAVLTIKRLKSSSLQETKWRSAIMRLVKLYIASVRKTNLNCFVDRIGSLLMARKLLDALLTSLRLR